MKRYILTLIASVCIITPSFAWTADSSWGTNYNFSSNFTISTADQLAQFASMVNSGYSFAYKTITLANDIDLAGQSWTPIGTASKPFQGAFDGQSHTISNLYIYTASTSNVGFFGYSTNTSWTQNSIKNTNLSGISITGSSYVGGLIGYADGDITVTNCSTKDGSITATSTSSSNYIGGLIGYSSSASGGAAISYCSSNIDVTASNTRAGGLIGYLKTGNLNYCYATGSVTSSSNSVGGLLGYLDGTGSATNCFATGKVSGVYYTGGLIGVLNTSSSNACRQCYAMGSVTGYSYVGGCIGSTSAWGQITDCYATGVVSGSSSYVGGFVGFSGSNSNTSSSGGATFTNCYATGNVIGASSFYTGGFLGYADGNWSGLNNCFSDSQGTAQSTVANGYFNNNPSTKTTANMLTASMGGNFSNSSAYYPQLNIFANSSDSETKAWSALSVIPLILGTSTETTSNINQTFTAPAVSAANSNLDLTWAAGNITEYGALIYITNSNTTLIPFSTGYCTFTATDSEGRTKYFYIDINTAVFSRYYVQPNGNDNNSGTDFRSARALKTIGKALSKCTNTKTTYQIWVGAGTYTLTSPLNLTQNNIMIYGGFIGNSTSEKPNSSETNTQTLLNGRNFKTNSTIITSSTLSNLINATGSNWTGSFLDGFTITGATTGSTAVSIPTGASIYNCKVINNKGKALNLATGASGYNLLIADNGTNSSDDAVTMTGTAALTNATIVNNQGAAINSASSTPKLANSILWNNKGGNINGTTPDITYSAASSQYISGYESNIWNANNSTTHNIELFQRTPNFKDATNTTVASRNYELLLLSPCLSKGNSNANNTPLDANGNLRTYNNDIDLGAFQKVAGDGYVIDGSTLSQFRTPSATPTQYNLSNAEVMINPGGVLNLTTSISPSVLIINDDNTQPAPVITGSSVIATKVYYVKKFTRYRTDNTQLQAWNAFSVPFSVAVNQIDGGIEQNTILIGQYNEQTRATSGANRSAWEYLATTATLTPNKGYVLELNSSVPESVSKLSTSIIFPSSGSVTFDNSTMDYTGLTNSTSTYWYDKGWNFISNPSVQAVNFANVPGYWPYGLSDSGINGYAGGVYFYRPDGDYYDVVPLAIVNAAGIAPYTSFFIKTTTQTKVRFAKIGSGSSPVKTIRFNRVSAAATTEASIDSVSIFNLHAENSDKQYGNAYVIFHPQAHREIADIEDSPNMSPVSSGSNVVINTFATGDNTGLGINAMPFTGSSVKIPVNISFPKDGAYTLTLPIKDDTKLVYLEDSNGIYHDLSTGYSFTASSSVKMNANIIFVAKNSDQTISDSGKVRLVQIDKVAVITGTDNIQKVAVYTESGNLIKVINNPSSYPTITLPTQTGLYLVRIYTDQETFTKKVIIH